MRPSSFRDMAKNQRSRHIVSNIVLIILGVLMAVFSTFAAELFSVTAGVLLLILGSFMLIIFLWTFFLFDPWMLLKALVLIGFGTLAIRSPETFMSWIFYIVAIYFVYQGILEMVYSVNLKGWKASYWWADFIYGLLLFLSALSLLILDLAFPGIGYRALMITAGSLLCLEGVLGLILIFLTKRTYSKWGKGPNDKDHPNVVAEQ